MLAPPELLSSPAPKAPGMYDRTTPIEETLEKLPEIARAIGITRIADLTELDRPRIPVMCAVVPDSHDIISVYNGKGLTLDAARVGCVMEALERQTALHPKLPLCSLLNGTRDDAMDARDFGLREEWHDRPIDFVAAWDALHDRNVLVPLAAVRPPASGPRVIRYESSNGLASGNTWLEAAYHATMELIERHVWSLAALRGHIAVRLLLDRLAGSSFSVPLDRIVDNAVGHEILIPTGFPAVDALIECVQSEYCLRLILVREARLPYTVFATVASVDRTPRTSYTGMGTSWSPAHAAIRALTEAVQSRVCDIQGAREDLGAEALQGGPPPTERGETLPANGRWYFDAVLGRRSLDSWPDMSSADLAVDFALTLSRLAEYELPELVLVSLPSPVCSTIVVRAIAPGLETTVIDRRLGPRARAMLDSLHSALDK